MQRQKGLRTAHFGDTVLPEREKIAKKLPIWRFFSNFGDFFGDFGDFFPYWQHCVAEVSRAQSFLPFPGNHMATL